MSTEDTDQLVANDFNNLLRGGEGRKYLFSHGFLLDVLDQLLDDPKVDIGFEEGDADLPQRGLHVLRSQLSLAAHVLENTLQLLG